MRIQCLTLLLFIILPAFSENKFEIELRGQEMSISRTADNIDMLDLIDIHEINNSIIVDIRYATKNNIMKKVLYSSAKCYFRKHVAIELDKIQKELEPMGLGLKIWDGFRPWQVQLDGYEQFPNLFAKPTEEASMHPKGVAVDLTLVDKKGNEILMPTEFDDITEKAFRTAVKEIDKQAIENREILETIMVKHGFVPYPYEWWHFMHYSWKSYPTIRLTFEEIATILKKQSSHQ